MKRAVTHKLPDGATAICASRWKSGFYALASAGYLVGVFYMAKDMSRRHEGVFSFVFVSVCAVLGSRGFYVYARQTVRAVPAVVLDNEGVRFLGGLRSRLVRWEDIEDVRGGSYFNQQMVSLIERSKGPETPFYTWLRHAGIWPRPVRRGSWDLPISAVDLGIWLKEEMRARKAA